MKVSRRLHSRARGEQFRATAIVVMLAGCTPVSLGREIDGSVGSPDASLDSCDGAMCAVADAGVSGIPNGTYAAVSRTCMGIADPPYELPELVITGMSGSYSGGVYQCASDGTFSLAYPSAGALALTIEGTTCNPDCDPSSVSCSPLAPTGGVLDGTFVVAGDQPGDHLTITFANSTCGGATIDGGTGPITEVDTWVVTSR